MKKANHEIVRVVQPAFLVNSNRHACRYETADGQPLTPGYYFALWPSTATARSYDRKVRYFGPFTTHEEAALVQDCAQYLRLVAPADAFPHGNGDGPLTAAVRTAYVALLEMVRSPGARQTRCVATQIRGMA